MITVLAAADEVAIAASKKIGNAKKESRFCKHASLPDHLMHHNISISAMEIISAI
jgi:hypothetical protein